MKRWQKVTIWIASILIVLVVGGLFAANYAVDKVLNSMVGMDLDDLLEEEDNVVGGEDSNGEASPTPDTVTPDENVNPEAGDSSTDQLDGAGQQDGSNVDGQDTNSTEPGSNDKQQGSSDKPTTTDKPTATTKPEGNKSDSGYSAEISTDKAKEVQENISVAEKAKVVTTLMGSLSASDIATLQKLASGGLSVEEKKEAKAIMLEKLSEDQYNELIAIAAKHGLSQGKTYSETEK